MIKAIFGQMVTSKRKGFLRLDARRYWRTWGWRWFIALLWPNIAFAQVVTGSGPIRVLCIGNSITQGNKKDSASTTSYPWHLAQKLGSEYTVINCGKSGATLLRNGDRPYHQTSEYRAALKANANIIVVKLGTNDSKPQNWDLHKSEFSADYNTLLDSLTAANPGAKVLLCAPVPAFENKFKIDGFIIRHGITPLVRKVAKKHRYRYLNLGKNPKSYIPLFYDGVHPTTEGSVFMADVIAKAITKL